MTSTMPSAREALAEASDFARDAWRDCWPVMLVIVIGRTLVFLGHHVSSTEWAPGLWPTIGEVLTLAYIPLFGAMYRLGVGGLALDSLGWGGFQWTRVEWRLLGVWVVLGFALSICATPLAIVSFPLLYLFQHHAAVSLGPLGGWSFASILLAPFWLGFAAFVLFMWGRLGLAAAITTVRGRISPFASWSMTRGLGWTIGGAWLVTQLPMVLGWVGLWAMGLAEAGDASAGPAEIWPLTDAAIAGVVVSILATMIQAPLSVGLLSGLYRWLAQDAGEAVPAMAEENTAAPEEPAAPEPEVEPEPEGPPKALSLWPHTVLPRRARAAPESLNEPTGADLVDEPVIPHPSEGVPEAEPPHAPETAIDADPVVPPEPEPGVLAHDAEPSLASAHEPDQITQPDETGREPEPHA